MNFHTFAEVSHVNPFQLSHPEFCTNFAYRFSPMPVASPFIYVWRTVKIMNVHIVQVCSLVIPPSQI